MLCIIFLCFSISSYAQGDKLSAGAALLFKNVKSSLTVAEKNKLYQQLGLKVAPDKQGFMIDEAPVSVFAYPTDMNKDGKEELFVVFDGAALFGDRGSVSLYIKNSTGALQQQPDISGGRPLILTSVNQGYPDIVIGGPGFEFPVYRWNGATYTLYKKMKDSALTEKNSKDIEEYSKLYMGK
jgi:hypothetical protein